VLCNQALDVLEILDFGAVRDAEADDLDFLSECWRSAELREDIVSQSLVVFVCSEVLLVTNAIKDAGQPLPTAECSGRSWFPQLTHGAGQTG
jgi:hypothetical protein